MKTNRLHARELKRGMSFDMFKAECFVVHTELNKIGQTIVHFVKNPSDGSKVSSLVVTRDFLFKTRT